MTHRRYFSGIGSRECPKSIGNEMTILASQLEEMGYWLLSGCANGADSFFQDGIKNNAQILLPWKDFNIEQQLKHPTHEYLLNDDDEEADKMVDQFHAAPQNLNEKTRKFHKRNIRQVLPIDNKPSEFVIYWTPNGNWQGGTKTALECAKFNEIPTFSMYHFTRQEILKEIEKLNFLYN